MNNPGGGGGGGGGGKRRAPKALSLGSEESIGDSMLAAASSGKGAAALHREDPALAFFKHAAGSALAHHYEEVLANHRFAAALGGTYTMEDSAGVRRSDGEPAQCEVEFKVGPRKKTREAFELLSLPEVRGVIADVLGELGGDAAKLELLKPFKMALVSPRVFWNLVRLLGGDVAAGLRQLLPAEDWSFLDERMARMSAKAEENERQREEEEAEAAAAARRPRPAAPPSRTGPRETLPQWAWRHLLRRTARWRRRRRGAHGGVPRVVSCRRRGGGAAVQLPRRGCQCQHAASPTRPRRRRRARARRSRGGRRRRLGGTWRGDAAAARVRLRLRLHRQGAAAQDRGGSRRRVKSGGELHPPLARAWYLHGDAPFAEHRRWSPSPPRTAATLHTRYRAR